MAGGRGRGGEKRGEIYLVAAAMPPARQPRQPGAPDSPRARSDAEVRLTLIRVDPSWGRPWLGLNLVGDASDPYWGHN